MSTLATLLHTISSHSGDINCVSFSGKVLATCSGDKSVRLWNIDDYQELPASPLLGHTYYVHDCVFSAFGTLLASCSRDGKVILWDIKSGDKIATLQHPSKTGIRTCQFSPNTTLLATGGDDDAIGLFDVSTKTFIRCLEGHDASVVAVAFTPDSSYLVSGSTNGDLRLWDAQFGHSKCLLYELDGHDLGVACCEFSPTYGSGASQDVVQASFLLATGGNDNNVKLWDVMSFPGTANVHLNLRVTLTGHEAPVMSVSFAPNGKILASASGDKSVIIWDPLKGVPLHTIDAHSRYVTCCAFSSNGRLLATGSNDKTVKVWKMTTEADLEDDCGPDEVLIDFSDQQFAKPYKEWSIDDVCSWIGQIGLSQYEENFRTHAIDGTELLTLSHETLEKDLKIVALGHRNKLLRAVKYIKEHPIIQPKDQESGIPNEFLCPITCEMMKEPVIASDGYTYERVAIAAWMTKGKQNSPMTNAPLPNKTLTPNRSLKMLIQRYQQGTDMS
ncbi:WD repeat, SAM and U-box domain-containing protein 1-like isoform X2 [Lineus longissimus]|uniref:WD repeat, SAM and U-box domain-containing protein 1-like isoform X2 n=1 Tax=Lineus longissimus TaxID=88925 RepID=UPI00315CE81A